MGGRVLVCWRAWRDFTQRAAWLAPSRHTRTRTQSSLGPDACPTHLPYAHLEHLPKERGLVLKVGQLRLVNGCVIRVVIQIGLWMPGTGGTSTARHGTANSLTAQHGTARCIAYQACTQLTHTMTMITLR
jgi:hypothetical protein